MSGQAAHNFGFMASLIAAIGLSVSVDARSDMDDDPLLTTLMIDQLEARDVDGDNGVFWDVQGWLGQDLNKIWFKTDGDRTAGKSDEAEMQLLYSKAIARYWDIQVGVRHDFEPSASRNWLAIGFKGVAPYFFDIDATAFVGESGRVAVRFEVEYEVLLTQRLILTPDIEVNLYAQNNPGVGIGSGLSDIETGLRLRYEIRREFAPYIGVNWTKLFGNTSDFAEISGQDRSTEQIVIGLRARF